MDIWAERPDSSEAPNQMPEERTVGAEQDLFSFAGAIDLGFETGADNDEIDADLTKAHAN